MKKTLLILSVLGLSMTMAAQTINFESDAIGSTGGTTVGWGGTVDVMANPYINTINPSAQVLHANSTNYMPIYFGNVALPAGAETLYSTLRFKILVVGGGDINYPTLNIYSSTDAWAFGSNPTPFKIAAIGYANLWGTAEIGVWKTVEFSLSSSLLIPIPAGHLVLNLSKGSSATTNCEYLIDDVELVATSTGLNPLKENATNVYFSDNNTIQLGKVVNQADVVDMNGRLMISAKNISSLNAASLHRGVYMVKSTVDGQNYISKIVK